MASRVHSEQEPLFSPTSSEVDTTSIFTKVKSPSVKCSAINQPRVSHSSSMKNAVKSSHSGNFVTLDEALINLVKEIDELFEKKIENKTPRPEKFDSNTLTMVLKNYAIKNSGPLCNIEDIEAVSRLTGIGINFRRNKYFFNNGFEFEYFIPYDKGNNYEEGVFEGFYLIEGKKVLNEKIWQGQFLHSREIGKFVFSKGTVYYPDGKIEQGIWTSNFKNFKRVIMKYSIGMTDGSSEWVYHSDKNIRYGDWLENFIVKNNVLSEGSVTYPDGKVETGIFKPNEKGEPILMDGDIYFPNGFVQTGKRVEMPSTITLLSEGKITDTHGGIKKGRWDFDAATNSTVFTKELSHSD